MNAMTNNPTTLKQAARQWSSRPDDERFTSLPAMLDFSREQRNNSRSLAISSRRIEAQPVADDQDRMTGLAIVGPIETLWDAGTGITAYAKGIKHQDARVDVERAAGRVLAMA